MSPESWASILDGADARLDLSFLAISGADVVGYVFNENGWGPGRRGVESQRRRVADGTASGCSVLVAASLSAFATAGFASVGLRVDSESLTGANRLSRTLGFGPACRSLTYARSPH